MWEEQNKTIAEIARAIGRVDKDNPKDSCRSVRNAMYRMRRWGYDNEHGEARLLWCSSGNTQGFPSCGIAGWTYPPPQVMAWQPRHMKAYRKRLLSASFPTRSVCPDSRGTH